MRNVGDPSPEMVTGVGPEIPVIVGVLEFKRPGPLASASIKENPFGVVSNCGAGMASPSRR